MKVRKKGVLRVSFGSIDLNIAGKNCDHLQFLDLTDSPEWIQHRDVKIWTHFHTSDSCRTSITCGWEDNRSGRIGKNLRSQQ
jgi:hypothetical protein